MIVEGILAFFMTGGLIGYLGLEGRASLTVRRASLSLSLIGVFLGVLWSPRFIFLVLATSLFGGIISYSRFSAYKEQAASIEMDKKKVM